MSGTSLDGLDIASCTFSQNPDGWSYSIEHAITIEYDDQWKSRLKNLMQASAEELAKTDFDFGYYCGEASKKFISEHKLKPDFISSHGHTIFHQPLKGFTYQIGNGAAIAAKAGIPVVNDFRSLDVALGGQGAPLVPIGDKLLFSEYDFCLNLGGISNISFDHLQKRLAFDICPVNIILNYLSQKEGKEYDQGGTMAFSGQCNELLLGELNKLAFYNEKFPKSLGREWIDLQVIPLIEKFNLSIPDTLNTFCHHIAIQINHITLQYSNNYGAKVLTTGGGAFNNFLINLMNEKAEGKVRYVVPEKGIVMFKEALIFAFLGVLRMLELPNCLSSVTGAAMNNIGGSVYIAGKN